MGDSLSTALALLDDRLDELHELMTEEPVEIVTERYRAWKSATRAALADLVVESAVKRFDLAEGASNQAEGRRPTPAVFLDAAASRACLMAMKEDLEADPAAVLRLPPSEPRPAHPMAGIHRILRLLERRLPKAFRGRPETDRDVRNGFETLLAGAGIAYEREGASVVHASRNYVPDFIFPGLQTALELKLCDSTGREPEIVAEINDEIAAYRPTYPHVVFGVYDLGFIREPDRFAAAFETRDGVWVRVMKARPASFTRESAAASDTAPLAGVAPGLPATGQGKS